MEKWVEKKQALEELNKEADYPKLAEKSAIELVTLAKRLINDSNVQVMLQTMKLIGLLAKGQRKYFDNYAKQFLSVLLQKFKDKKTQVLQETHSTLDNLMFSITLEHAFEDIKEALEDKTPSVKTNTCQWLERLFETVPLADTKSVAKNIALIMKKNTDDSTPDVRQSSFKILAVLLSKCPEIINPVIKDLPAAKIKKLEEAGGPANDGHKGKEEEKSVEKAKAEPPSAKEPKKGAKTGPPIVKTPQAPNKPQTAPGKPPAAPVEEDTNNAISAEEAESIVSGFLPSEMMTQLKDNA